MARRYHLSVILSVLLLGQALGLPASLRPRGFAGNEVDTETKTGANDLAAEGSISKNMMEEGEKMDRRDIDADSSESAPKPGLATPDPFSNDDDDDDEDFDPVPAAPAGGGGSNIFSLLRLANALFPSSSSGGNENIQNLIAGLLNRLQKVQSHSRTPRNAPQIQRIDLSKNTIDVDHPQYKHHLKRDKNEIESESQVEDSEDASVNESENVSQSRINSDASESQVQDSEYISESEDTEEDDDDDDASSENNAGEESVETNGNGNKNGNVNGNASKASNGEDDDDDDDDEFDSDEPPEGDGQGGGILGILAGLSGGEDGQSDLGSLLATVSGIIGSLSGDGVDVNALIASGIGLFVGLLSEGDENPGSILASYLLTSLDTLTGGGANNNGAFFASFLSKLIKGTSAGGDPDASDENAEQMKDSAGFYMSFLMTLLGDMSKGSSGGGHQPMERIGQMWSQFQSLNDTIDRI